MLESRIIPFLLTDEMSLVKTVKFAEPKYLGDPLNAVRVFNEMAVDELFIANRDASLRGNGLNMSRLADFARECRMPLSYAGGVSTPVEVEELINLGIEKVGIGSQFITNPGLVSDAANRVGSQSVAVVLDYRDDGCVCSKQGSLHTGLTVGSLAKEAEARGAAEIVLNSIDGDGTYRGLDTKMLDSIQKLVKIPVTIVGGASSLNDVARVAKEFWPVGIGVGSLFTLTGKFRSPLLSYPTRAEKESMAGIERSGELG